MKDHQESRTFIHGDEGRRGAARSGTSGVGLSKMTKALRPKRPALIPMLDRVIQKYLQDDDLGSSRPRPDRLAPDRALRRTGGKARLVRFERDA
jgi:hypothetical protein